MNLRRRFRVAHHRPFALSTHDPDDRAGLNRRDDVIDALERNRETLVEQQTRLYAEGRRSVLICLQGMDTAGKDGVVNHILGALNPLGCRVTSFREPSAEEKAHDFLWRYHTVMPSRGWIGIFNRTHYEGVLIERVHAMVTKATIESRLRQIAEFERMLSENGTTILKFMLHISKAAQLQRFKDRFDDPLKQWKISESDYRERELWDDYMHAYADALGATSTPHAPWYVIPSNHKWFRDFAVSQIVADTFRDLDIAAPKPSVDLALIERRYHQAKKEG
jgi:PPK2 family polyphosphate:nucleotide phosphotransferase